MKLNIRLPALIFIWTFFFLKITHNASSQAEIQVEYSNSPVQLDKIFKITVSISNEKLKSISNFPEIEDFIKGKTFFIKGKKSYVVEQEYIPVKAGTFTIHPFNLMVNGKKVSFKEKEIIVKSFKHKFYNKFLINEPTDKNHIENEPDAFFSVSSDKKAVYTGEAFELTAAFFIAKDNNAEFNFINIKEQVSKIIKRLKPAHSWIEEKDMAEEMPTDSATVNNKAYIKYTVYSANLYSFDTIDIAIPSVEFKIINYKINRTPLVVERQAFYHTLTSAPFNIKIKVLPPNTMKDRVAVGKFSLEERISPNHLRQGEMLKYYFTVKSAYGLSSISSPAILENSNLEIFTPRISLKKYHENNQLLNGKIFEYPVIPRASGKFSLKDYFCWIYFNTSTGKYDTLRPKLVLNIQKSTTQEEIQVNIHQAFYEKMILTVSNKIKSKEKDDRIKWISNILILFMLVSTIILILKK